MAVTVTLAGVLLDAVVMLKVALVMPCRMVTVAGVWTREGMLLESVTEIPPAGAALLIVTVPVTEPPATTLLLESVRFVSVGGT